jgi:hypothetical protein
MFTEFYLNNNIQRFLIIIHGIIQYLSVSSHQVDIFGIFVLFAPLIRLPILKNYIKGSVMSITEKEVGKKSIIEEYGRGVSALSNTLLILTLGALLSLRCISSFSSFSYYKSPNAMFLSVCSSFVNTRFLSLFTLLS